MVEVTNYRYKNIGVYGLGKTGTSAIYSLRAGNSNVVAWDDDENRRIKWTENLDPLHILYCNKNILRPPNHIDWKKIDNIVLTPGIPKNHYVFEMIKSINCNVISDIELLYETCNLAKYIGITGSNGKSTATSLIGHIYSDSDINHQVGGNIGVAALELHPLTTGDYYILEVSSYQLDLFKNLKFDVSVLLNITPDHLSYHENLDNYIKAKMKIFDNQITNDISIISVDDDIMRSCYQFLKKNSRSRIIPISTKNIIEGGITVIGDKLYDHIDINSAPKIYDIDNEINLPGEHNKQNIAASYAVCINNMNSDYIIKQINSFSGLSHRMELIAIKDNITFINDSKATNSDATESALKYFKNIYWIVGGRKKENGIDNLTQYFTNIKHAFLIGESEEEFANLMAGKLSYTKCNNLKHAFGKALKLANSNSGDITILLSPACASFDQWNNFEERGDAFRNLVLDYIK